MNKTQSRICFAPSRCRWRVFVAAALSIGLTFLSLHVALAVDAVTVDAGTVIQDITRGPVGINVNYLMDSERARLSAPPRTTQAALQEMQMKFLRYPGGSKSQSYLWSLSPWTSPNPQLACTGTDYWPANSRQFTLSDNATWIPGKAPMNFDEYMQLCQSTGAQPNIVLCYNSAYFPAKTGDVTPTLTKLVNTAVEWVRYANITKGYGVKYWSLGNETDYAGSWPNSQIKVTATQYAADLVTFSQAMKAVDPTIKIGANGQSTSWFQTVLTNASSAIDFLDVHQYAGQNFTSGYENYRTTNGSYCSQATMAISAISSYAPAADQSRIHVVVSESGAHDWAGYWPNANDLGHAVVFFEQIGQHLQLPSVDFVQYWNTRWVDNDSFSLPVGTTNLLTNNPGFESGLTGWTIDWDATPGNSHISGTAADIHSGTAALCISGSTTGGKCQDVTSLFSPNKFYTLGCWAKVTATAQWSGFGVNFSKSGTSVATVGYSSSTISGTGYKQYVVPFQAPASFDSAIFWVYKSASTDVLYVDDCSVVTGGIPGDMNALGAANQLFASGQVLSIWGKYLQSQIISASKTTMVHSFASRSPSTNYLSVFLINKDTITHDTTVTLKNYPGAAYAQTAVFTGSSPTDCSPVLSQTTNTPVSANNLSLTLAPVSITVLTLQASPTIAQHATATSNPITSSASTNLSVLGADDGGEANLTYTWAVSGTTPGPVAFSANGTNAAKNVVATFSMPGSYNLAVSVMDSGGLTVSDTVTVNVQQSFSLWQQSQFTATELSNQAFSGPLATPAHDGISNLMKYAIGLNPHLFRADALPYPAFASGTFSLNYKKDTTKTDLTIYAEGSSDLSAWSTDGVADTLIQDGAIQLRQATVPATGRAQFLRLKVTRP